MKRELVAFVCLLADARAGASSAGRLLMRL
jgi:hypothetical protein